MATPIQEAAARARRLLLGEEAEASVAAALQGRDHAIANPSATEVIARHRAANPTVEETLARRENRALAPKPVTVSLQPPGVPMGRPAGAPVPADAKTPQPTDPDRDDIEWDTGPMAHSPADRDSYRDKQGLMRMLDGRFDMNDPATRIHAMGIESADEAVARLMGRR